MQTRTDYNLYRIPALTKNTLIFPPMYLKYNSHLSLFIIQIFTVVTFLMIFKGEYLTLESLTNEVNIFLVNLSILRKLKL